MSHALSWPPLSRHQLIQEDALPSESALREVQGRQGYGANLSKITLRSWNPELGQGPWDIPSVILGAPPTLQTVNPRV